MGGTKTKGGGGEVNVREEKEGEDVSEPGQAKENERHTKKRESLPFDVGENMSAGQKRLVSSARS